MRRGRAEKCIFFFRNKTVIPFLFINWVYVTLINIFKKIKRKNLSNNIYGINFIYANLRKFNII